MWDLVFKECKDMSWAAAIISFDCGVDAVMFMEIFSVCLAFVYLKKIIVILEMYTQKSCLATKAPCDLL